MRLTDPGPYSRAPAAGLHTGRVRERDPAPAAGSDTAEEPGVGVETAGRQTEAGQAGHFPHHLLCPGRVRHEAQPGRSLAQHTVPAVLLRSKTISLSSPLLSMGEMINHCPVRPCTLSDIEASLGS